MVLITLSFIKGSLALWVYYAYELFVKNKNRSANGPVNSIQNVDSYLLLDQLDDEDDQAGTDHTADDVADDTADEVPEKPAEQCAADKTDNEPPLI